MRIAAALLPLALIAGCAEKKLERDSYAPVLEASEPVVSVPSAFTAEHYTLTVPADRTDPSGGSVTLPVIIIKAQEPSELPPIVRISGGPGTEGLSAAAYPGAYPWTKNRDFIIFAQRGTAYASPALRCPGLREAFGEVEGSGEPLEVIMACAERLRSEGVDTSDYHTAAVADDLEDLRIAFGHNRWSLYGLSYGTRVALTYAREHGEALDALVLDSPLPHQAKYDDTSAENFRLALASVAEDCAAEPACAEAYPDLGQRFFAAIAAAEDAPFSFATETEITELTATDLVSLVNLSSAQWISYAPAIMDAIARRDGEAILPLVHSGLGSDYAWGQRLSVWCSEALPYSERARGKPDAPFAGLESAAVRPELCEAFGVAQRPAAEVAATVSDVPTLIVAGAYDPSTPPSFGQIALETLSRGEMLTIAKGGHTETNNWSGDGCAMKAAHAFLDDPAGYLDGSAVPACTTERAPPPFVIAGDD
ncbi:alpha/beta hydrolase [Parvularcula sp. ZS-1/3]|uniref:Proline iminopeptidase n=1 Tax=Parvularcula mediterranea TaxID=2732508 RepID=A0A7Y3RMT4_9PROT|nr:alpha/beta hydrolase [Parvularcula mediterranea]NNU16909.1 alpha/beta hydrolase [Parvularcula mediterranea]